LVGGFARTNNHQPQATDAQNHTTNNREWTCVAGAIQTLIRVERSRVFFMMKRH